MRRVERAADTAAVAAGDVCSCRWSASRRRPSIRQSVPLAYIIVVTGYDKSTTSRSTMTPALTSSTNLYSPVMTSPTGSPYFPSRRPPTTNHRSTRCHVTSTSFPPCSSSARSTTVRRRGESLLVTSRRGESLPVTSRRVQRATPVNFVPLMRGIGAEVTSACL